MIAERVARVLGRPVRGAWPLGGGCVGAAYRVELAGGGEVFAKALENAPHGFFAAEAAGLGWLGDAQDETDESSSSLGGDLAASLRAVPVPQVLGHAEDVLVLEWIPPGAPSPAGAEAFGRSLAALHQRGAPAYGAPWPGFIGPLPLDNEAAAAWPRFYADQRLAPYLRRAVDRGAMMPAQAQSVERVIERIEELAGPPEPPGRIHGDLWAGNVHWDAHGRGWLIDPAAHGGHRETDLAMLALFGAPYLDRIVAAYQEVFPLAPGWRDRLPLHQLHPLLVHAALFAGAYGRQAASAARAIC